MSSQPNKLNAASRTRKPKSVGGTPIGSPVLGKTVNKVRTTEKPEDQHDTSAIVDVERLSLPASDTLLEVTTVLTKSISSIIHCPCEMLDRKCVAIKCTSCSKEWHT